MSSRHRCLREMALQIRIGRARNVFISALFVFQKHGELTTTRNTIAGARSERTGSPPLKLSTVVAIFALGSDMLMIVGGRDE
jgi:hypothetical protein